jgi:hypothetical protein
MGVENGSFEVPEAFLKQLNEFSGGAYVLFVMDEKGNPQVYGQSDDAILSSHLFLQIQGWVGARSQELTDAFYRPSTEELQEMRGFDEDQDDEDDGDFDFGDDGDDDEEDDSDEKNILG